MARPLALKQLRQTATRTARISLRAEVQRWQRPLHLAALTLCIAALVGTSISVPTVSAETETRLRLDQASAEPAYLAGYTRLRLHATAVTLQGAFIPLTGKNAFVLKLGSTKKKIQPLVGAFEATDEPMAVAIVVMTGFEFADDLAEIKKQLATLIESFPKSTNVSVISYADSVKVSVLDSPTAALRKIKALAAEPVPAENELIKAVKRAIRVLGKAKFKPPTASARKFIVLVSDGKDLDPAPARYRKAGEAAAKKRIRIHSVAFSPNDDRVQLLGLGELSKRSFGTFRWVRNNGLFGGQFASLAIEVARQYVLTFFVPSKDLSSKITLLAGEATSNSLTKVKSSCGTNSCDASQYCHASRCITRAESGGMGALTLVLLIVGGAAALLVLLAFIGYLLSRRAQTIPMPGMDAGLQPNPIGMAPEAHAASAGETSNRIVAYGPQGRAIGGGPAVGAGSVGGQHAALGHSPASGQQTAGHPSHPATPASAQANAHLVAHATVTVVTGPLAGQQFSIAHGTTVGTHSSCAVKLAGDGFVSSIHAQFLANTAGQFSIVDKGSTNGTFVNGVRTQNRQLAHGMTVKIGSVDLRFLLA